MGTHCFIGIEDDDGTVRHIMLNQDGYPSNIIERLRDNNCYDRSNVEAYLEDLSEKRGGLSVTDNVYDAIEHWYAGQYSYLFSNENEWLYRDSEKHGDFVFIDIDDFDEDIDV
jgi:hypothetical protein